MATATDSGTFSIGGDLEVTRLGYGAMRITGDGIWGDPPDHDRAIAVLRATRELGIDFIDTADSYGPYVSEDLIREALWADGSYGDTHVATKAGLTRTGPGQWPPLGRPEYLRQCCEMSLRRLGVETIDLFQLHRIDAEVPRDEQFGLLKELQDEGKVRHVGLSEVTVEEIEAARKIVEVATVQNLYNVAHRDAAEVVAYCDREQIGFIPWFPMASGALADQGGPVQEVADAHDVSVNQVALAWLLQSSDVILPIPGTSSVAHLEENMKAASLELDAGELDAIAAAA